MLPWIPARERYKVHESFGGLPTFFSLHPGFNLLPELLAAILFEQVSIALAQFSTHCCMTATQSHESLHQAPRTVQISCLKPLGVAFICEGS